MTSTSPEDLTCRTCRNHTLHRQPNPLWFEGEGQMRTDDEDQPVWCCHAPASPHNGQQFLVPITCDAYRDGRVRDEVSIKSREADEALRRWEERRAKG